MHMSTHILFMLSASFTRAGVRSSPSSVIRLIIHAAFGCPIYHAREARVRYVMMSYIIWGKTSGWDYTLDGISYERVSESRLPSLPSRCFLNWYRSRLRPIFTRFKRNDFTCAVVSVYRLKKHKKIKTAVSPCGKAAQGETQTRIRVSRASGLGMLVNGTRAHADARTHAHFRSHLSR